MRIAVKRVIYFESTQLDGTIMVVKFLDRRHLCLAPDNVECTTYISCNILGKTSRVFSCCYHFNSVMCISGVVNGHFLLRHTILHEEEIPPWYNRNLCLL
ncbi:uncharacterized protein LOC113763093 isoform X1 [Coffea eugenioides]|uniref:uncharacterized protein LOC113763093 isoform X1 n=1 Tax=Coffea eugenioides TaxID=49369 RepID=UPI000F609B15|nr:uncharacterized protein LOC113763093 isoform X1 [Coffea eugenioides]